MQASRAVRFVAFLVGVAAAGAASAATPALVIDAESGKVLYAERATDPWYPASITKLMTAYVALSAVRTGKIALDTPLTVVGARAVDAAVQDGLPARHRDHARQRPQDHHGQVGQ